jgi:hypothetical protein
VPEELVTAELLQRLRGVIPKKEATSPLAHELFQGISWMYDNAEL